MLIADDSDLFAEDVRRVLESDPTLHVVGRAVNGESAVAMTAKLRPDLVVMDVVMPVLDGLGAIQKIMAAQPTPILVMTSDPRGMSGELALEATRRGALDLVMKSTDSSPEQEEALRSRVRFLAKVPVVRHQKTQRTRRAMAGPEPGPSRIRGIGIVSSTGGPAALATIMEGLPPSLPAGIAIVQHLPAGGFSESLADWLSHVCAFRVAVARGGERLLGGHVFIAPDHRHLVVDGEGVLGLTEDPPRKGFRPSADTLLSSLARGLGAGALGVVLTGIGSDGADGLWDLRQAGGRTFAQDQATSLIFGMPQAAWERGAVERQVPIGGMAEAIAAVVGDSGTARAAAAGEDVR